MRSASRKILFLQNDVSRHPCSRVDLRFKDAGFDVELYWAANGEFPESTDHYSGALIYASPHGAYEDIDWIQREHGIIQKLALLQIPMLGICFGSQILASALCGREQVFIRPQCEVGYKQVDLSCHDPQEILLHGLDNQVYMFIWHCDEVRADHPDMVVLGTTNDCPNQIWRYRNLPIWGIQGHPELTREEAQSFFKLHRDKLTRDGANVDELIEYADEAPDAKKLLNNFIQYCSLACAGTDIQESFYS